MSETVKVFTRKFLLNFIGLLAELKQQIHRMVELGLPVEGSALEMVAAGNRIVGFLAKNGEEDAHSGYFGCLIRTLEGAISKLAVRELAYLSSHVFEGTLRRQMKTLHPFVYRQYKERIQMRFGEWKALARERDTATLEEMRQAVKKFDDVIAAAASVDVASAMADEKRVRIENSLKGVFNPQKSAPPPIRHKHHKTGTKKGSNAEIPNTGGTSKKSRHAQRKRTKIAA